MLACRVQIASRAHSGSLQLLQLSGQAAFFFLKRLPLCSSRGWEGGCQRTSPQQPELVCEINPQNGCCLLEKAEMDGRKAGRWRVKRTARRGWAQVRAATKHQNKSGRLPGRRGSNFRPQQRGRLAQSSPSSLRDQPEKQQRFCGAWKPHRSTALDPSRRLHAAAGHQALRGGEEPTPS